MSASVVESLASGLSTAWISMPSTQSSRSERCSRTTMRPMPGNRSVSSCSAPWSPRSSATDRATRCAVVPRHDPDRLRAEGHILSRHDLQPGAQEPTEPCLVLRAATDQQESGHGRIFPPLRRVAAGFVRILGLEREPDAAVAVLLCSAPYAELLYLRCRRSEGDDERRNLGWLFSFESAC